MRKIYIAILSCFFILASVKVGAQANTYVFTSGTGGVLEDMSTGTTQLVGSGSDDGVSGVNNIGFSFTFAGTAYTQFSASANGLVRFGAAAVTDQWNNLDGTNGFTAAGTQPKIAAYWDDIATGTNGKVHYKVVGATPTAKLVVEWLVTVPRATGGPANATFQAWFEEGTNRITYVYGAGMLLNNANSGYTVGIASSPTDFQSITTATNTSSIATHNGSQTNAITSGTTYTFFPPPPCVPGSLAGGTASSSVPAACAIPFTISVTGASFGAGLTYVWEQSPTGLAGSWTDIAPAQTGQSLTITQSVATFYRRRIICGPSTEWSTSVQVTQNTLANCYCPVSYDNATEPITLVQFSNINNATSATVNGTPEQEDFTAIVGNVSKGQTYPLTVKGNTDGNFTTHINAYFDWNQDGDFDDAGEGFYVGSIVNSTGLDAVQASLNILIPAAALDGTTRMRIIKKFNTQAPPCNTLGFGQAEDYTLSITTPLCIAPSAVSVGSITSTSAGITFTAAGTAYVEYGPPGFTPGTGAAAGVGGTVVSGPSVVTLPGLTPNTVYDVYVRQDCGGGIFSGNAIGGSFRTLCTTITTFPYTETFEAASTTRPCWVPTQVSGAVNWTFGAGAGNGGTVTTAHGGSLNARHFGGGTGSVARLVSPLMNLSAMNPTLGAQVTFWYANQDWLGDQNQMRIYYRTSSAGTWTLIPGAVYTANVGQWTEVELLLPSSGGAAEYQIAFEGTELFGRGVAVDDVTIAQAPSCPKPAGVSALAISPTTINVNFTALPATGYVVEYGPPGFVPGTGATPGGGIAVVLGNASPIQITGLTPGSTYDVYIRRLCAPGDLSLNVLSSATTLCPAVNVPYLQDFETSTPPAGFPTCTSMEDVNGNSGPDGNVTGGRWTTFAGTSAQTYVSPTRVGRYLYDLPVPTRGADDWFYIRGLNLTGGTSYRLKFFFKASDGPAFIERLEVKYGTAAINTSQTNLIYTNNDIRTAIATPWDSAIVDFTPAATDVYYLGFHAMSLPDQAFLYIDDISVKVTPLVDVGATALTGPSCPATDGALQVTIRNYNTTPQNFATYPVTVTANVTGAATTTLTTTVNTGTLAPGATMIVALPPFNYAAGIYNVTVSTASPNDPETGNDSHTTSFLVNPSPAVATVTPASAAICAGDSIQLRTQFVTPPAPPVTHPLVTSGAISVAIPDASTAGTTHTLAVAGIPAGATITNISVTLNATHTWVNDLIINLRAPNGKILNLFNRKGGFAQANIAGLVVSNATGLPAIPAAGAPFTGTFAPDAGAGVGPATSLSNAASYAELLSAPNGNWTLSAADFALFDIGSITSWSISLTYAFPHPRVTWSPIAGLFTNSATTTAYTAGTNADSVFAEPATTTTYTVTTTNPLTGCTSTRTVTVTVNQLPVINITALPQRICLSDTLVALTASPAGGTWSGIGVSGSNFVPPATALGTFNLTYTYTDPLGCAGTNSIQATVQDCPERIILLRDNAVILFPNPNNGQFNIRINSILYNRLALRVYTSAGQLVHTQQFSGLVFNRVVPINLTHLPSGTYMVQFVYDGGVRTSEKTFKVVVGR